MKKNDLYMEKNTSVFYLVTEPSNMRMLFDSSVAPVSVPECIQYSPEIKLKCKVYVDLYNTERFTPVRSGGCIINTDLFNKFLEMLIKGDTNE